MADSKTTAVSPDSTATSPPSLPPVAQAQPTIAFNNSFGSPATDLAQTEEWDASKVPPSRFQKRKGSVFATPSSRDGGVARNNADAYHAKLIEKGYDKLK